MNAKGNKELSDFYFDKAVSSLMAVSDVTFDPMLTIQVANVLSAQQKYNEGMDLLLTLERKFERRADALLKLELYENLGHFAVFLKQYEKHLEYRVQAVEWAKLQNHDQRIAVAIYNEARAYQMLKQFEQSLKVFDKALVLAKQAKHNYLVSMTYYRKLTILSDLNRNDEAKKYLNLIDESVLFSETKKDVIDMKKAQK